jgi:hypothetical protein
MMLWVCSSRKARKDTDRASVAGTLDDLTPIQFVRKGFGQRDDVLWCRKSGWMGDTRYTFVDQTSLVHFVVYSLLKAVQLLAVEGTGLQLEFLSTTSRVSCVDHYTQDWPL